MIVVSILIVLMYRFVYVIAYNWLSALVHLETEKQEEVEAQIQMGRMMQLLQVGIVKNLWCFYIFFIFSILVFLILLIQLCNTRDITFSNY